MNAIKVKTRVYGPMFFDMLYEIAKSDTFVPIENEPSILELVRYTKSRQLLCVTLTHRGIQIKNIEDCTDYIEVTSKKFVEIAVKAFE
jgi:hypothetical protein